MSLDTNPKTQTTTIHCDGCGALAPICAAPGMDPLALLSARVQGWKADVTYQRCPACRARGAE